MKRLVACVFTICLFSGVSAAAGILYSNGTYSGVSGALIQAPYTVSDSFVLAAAGTMTGFDFASWTSTGVDLSSVNWEVGTTPFASNVASGLANSLATVVNIVDNVYTFDVDTNTVSGLNVVLGAGTYWFTVLNAVDSFGPIGWDQINGTSSAWQCQTGCGVSSNWAALTGTGGSSNVFDIVGVSSVPEPGSMGLLGGGILAMLGMLRRRKIG